VKDRARPRWAIWLNLEASREAAHWLPWRPDKTKGQTVEDCEDPDRQVSGRNLRCVMGCVSLAVQRALVDLPLGESPPPFV